MGLVMGHPKGGPSLAVRLDPERAEAAAGFDYFSIGVADRASIERLADHLTALGELHAGVHFASIGWILSDLHDPDGHDVRFYTIDAHEALEFGKVQIVHDPRETAMERERAQQGQTTAES
jgi:hypothetical protein